MGNRIRHLVVLSVFLFGAWPVSAHHGMSAVFDFNQRFTRTGVLSRLDWRNPHVFLIVEVEEPDGRMVEWAYEGPSPNYFRRGRVANKSDFEDSIGKTVEVEASRARDGSNKGLIRGITLANGKFVPLCPDNC